jgi:hypothetical protein
VNIAIRIFGSLLLTTMLLLYIWILHLVFPVHINLFLGMVIGIPVIIFNRYFVRVVMAVLNAMWLKYLAKRQNKI